MQTSKHYCGAILNYKRDHTPFWNFLRLLPLIDKARPVPFMLSAERDVACRCAVLRLVPIDAARAQG